MEETEIYKGSPSQWTNLGTYVMGILFCWLFIPVFIAIWRFLVVKTWKIKITNQRLIEKQGVLSKTTDVIFIPKCNRRLLFFFFLFSK